MRETHNAAAVVTSFVIIIVTTWLTGALLDYTFLNPGGLSFRQIVFFSPPHHSLLLRLAALLVVAVPLFMLFRKRHRAAGKYTIPPGADVLREIIKHNPAAVAVFDRDLRFVMAGDRYLRNFGLEGRDIAGKSHEELGLKIPEKWKGVYERCLAGSVESADDDYYVKPDGALEYCRWEVRPWLLPRGKTGGVIVYIDITTDRKKADEKIKEQYLHIQRQYRELRAVNEMLEALNRKESFTYDELARAKMIIDKAFQANPLAMSLSRYADGTFIDVNNAFLTLTGLGREEVIGKTAVELRIWNTLQERHDMIAKMHAHGFVRGIDTRVYMDHRGYRWIKYYGELVDTGETEDRFIVSVFQDITEQKLTQQSLLQSETRFRALFENSSDANLIIDEGRFVDCNSAALEMLGYPYKGMLLDKRPEDISPDTQQDGKNSKERMAGILDRAARGESFRFEWLHLRASGEVFPVEYMLAPIPLGERRIIYTVWRDLTERKRLELQFLQSQKMEAVGRLAGGVAHDFNNMLTTIIGYSELARLRIKRNDPLYAEVNEIREAAERAAALTRQLLAFSRKQMLEPEVFDLNRVIMEMEKMTRRMIGEDIDFSTSLDPRLYSIRADRGQVGQVVMNLVVNARDAMPGGGKLTVRTRNVHVDHSMCRNMQDARPGAFVCLSVEDEGEGMDKSIMNQIFEPFFSTKAEGEGTGLGLSTVYGIIQQHNGWINVWSEKGKGSIFRIYLPALMEKAGEVKAQSEPLKDYRGDGERVILVEDETGVREYIARVLKENGYHVVQAAGAEEALALFDTDSDFDLVFSDIVLTGMNGIQMVEEMLKIRPDIRVLFSSGYTDERTRLNELRERGFYFLQKPYVIIKLLKAVREILST